MLNEHMLVNKELKQQFLRDWEQEHNFELHRKC